jgi:enolase
MPKIKKILAREILDSRGNPTVEVKVVLDDKTSAKAAVPSGASTGVHEAWELRDGDIKRYRGQGVLKAVSNINTGIASKLKGMDVSKQADIDRLMIDLDGTANKSRLGANAILGVSLACARAAAACKNQELFEYLRKIYSFKSPLKLPTPSFNIFNGGKHADTNLDFQEFMIMPLTDWTFHDKLRAGSEIFHALGDVLKKAGLDTDVGNEGGYAPDISSSIQGIEFIMSAIIKAGYKPGGEIGLGIDVGSSELYDQHKQQYIFKLDQAHFSATSLVELYRTWLAKYPIVSIEDGVAEDDWEGWRQLTRELGDRMLLIGDDLFVTNIERLRMGLKERVANSILIKPNQVGTLTETAETIKFAQKHNYRIMISHRSGETCDDFIADLAVACGADFIKAGAPSRSERLAKYNRLLEIEEILNKTF